jgi:predicted nucleic acid-binding protein
MLDNRPRVFVDSNVVIYAYSSSEKTKREIARAIISENYTVISTQVLQEISHTLGRKYQFDYAAIKKTLHECIVSHNEVYVNRVQTVLNACEVAERYQFSFYDSLIIAAAIESKCNVLYSEDLQHHQIIHDTLTLINPFIR